MGEAQELHKGSPLYALEVKSKPFDKLLFIEKDPLRSEALRKIQKDNASRIIEIINADANSAIPKFCKGLGPLDRAVVFLDPYATELNGRRLRPSRKRGKSIAGYFSH